MPLGDPVAPDWGRIEAPVNIVQALGKILQGDPATWSVARFKNYGHTGKEVVVMIDAQGGIVVVQVGPAEWIRLNDPQGLPAINRLVNDAATQAAGKDESQLIVWMQQVAFLYSGIPQLALTNSFLDSFNDKSSEVLEDWMQGKEKNRDVFFGLCNDPRVTRHGNLVEFRVNMMTKTGAVEQWTLVVKSTKSMELVSLSVKHLCPAGTFSYALSG